MRQFKRQAYGLAAFVMDAAQHFRNDGFGWICVRCERDFPVEAPYKGLPRFMREGEAESKTPKLANTAIAKWADAARTTLICPRCGNTERIDS
jgi:hypothetical protein